MVTPVSLFLFLTVVSIDKRQIQMSNIVPPTTLGISCHLPSLSGGRLCWCYTQQGDRFVQHITHVSLFLHQFLFYAVVFLQ